MLLVLVVALAVAVSAAGLRGVAAGDASKYAGQEFTCFDGSKKMPSSRVNDDYCDCADGSDEPGTSACPSGTFFCLNRGHESKKIPSSQVDDGVCDCCDGSDESSLPCGNTCRELGEKTRLERVKQLQDVKAALEVRQTYLDKARAELPAKRSRREELQGKMTGEDAVLEAVNLKRVGAEKEWEAANDQKQWREKQREKQRVKEDEGFDDLHKDDDADDDVDLDGEEDKKTAATDAPVTEPDTQGTPDPIEPPASEAPVLPVAPEVPATPEPQVTEPPTEAPREKTIYTDMSNDELEQKVTELRAAFDEASRVHQEQVARKDEIKKELDTLEDLFRHNFVGEHQLYGIFGQCFTKQINEYNYNVCWMDKAEQSGTLLGKFANYKREGNELVMMYEGGVKCWGGEARSATVRVSCGATNEIVSVTEPNRCQYNISFRSPTACTQALLEQLQEQTERDNALLNAEEENVI